MEQKIGTIIKYPLEFFNETWYLQVTSRKVWHSCSGCIFTVNKKCTARNKERLLGKCGFTARKDNGVIFKLLYKIMENNTLRIEIPQGMVIDVANCELEKGIIKFKRKCPTYNQINDYLLENNIKGWLNVQAFPNNPYFRNLVKLFNIALYFNSASNKEGRYRILNGIHGYYVINTDINGMPEFRSKEDAELVIDNFQDILNEVFK